MGEQTSQEFESVNALVTGGGGFLGKAIVEQLLERGDTVRILARGDYPELAARGVGTMRGDIADKATVLRAVEGCDVVFHVAGKPGMWGPYESYRLTNVVGTENVIAACQHHGVSRLIYTSTPSVVHAGGDIEGANESLPYPDHYEGAYPATKAVAERAVLAANCSKLATVAIRPHLVWGPGDNHLIPRLLERARAGRMVFVGTEDKLIDTTYIDNAAAAHVQAALRLAPGAPCAGKAYFISQGEPWPASKITNAFLEAAGLPPVQRRIPVAVAYAIGAVAEFVWRVFRISGEPPVTRFVVRQMSTAHWYNITAAQKDLGYVATVSIEEGLAKLRRELD
ncbi:MAG: nucleoside-diphosphate-sugar epimerase [Hyphomicrobiaceae bacterium]